MTANHTKPSHASFPHVSYWRGGQWVAALFYFHNKIMGNSSTRDKDLLIYI